MRDLEPFRIVSADPLLNNAEAEWFKNHFENLAADLGFPTKPKVSMRPPPVMVSESGQVLQEATRPCRRGPAEQVHSPDEQLATA